MKAIKLKPLLFPKDDILVKPPEIMEQRSLTPGKQQNKVISSLSQLISILRGRRLKKVANENKTVLEDEKEIVHKLNEWKRAVSPKSPLMRKYSFKRMFTLSGIMSETSSPAKAMSKFSQISAPQAKTANKLTPIDTFYNVIQGVLGGDKQKKREKEEEIKKISEFNQEYEEQLTGRIAKLTKEIKGLKEFIRERSKKLEIFKKQLQELTEKYEEESSSLALMEAEELLFRDKDKTKRVIKQGEEKNYFMKKEKIRQLKQDLHKNFQEDKEKYENSIENENRALEAAVHQRRMSKKNLKEYREEIVMMYCRTLKDGKDVRTEGLRWIIKALWNMNEPVPISAFPKFLDEESAHFLLVMAEKDIQLNVYSNKLNELRRELHYRKADSATPSAKSLYSHVRNRIREISQSSIRYANSKPVFKENLDVNRNQLNKIDSSIYTEILEAREKLSKIQDFIKESTTAEIKRVTESYQLNSGGTAEVELFHIIQCLVGDKVREFNKYTRSNLLSKGHRSIILN